MPYKDEDTVVFLHPFKNVFDAVQATCKRFGWWIKHSDARSGCISAVTWPSLYSWGENVSIYVTKMNNKKTMVRIKSISHLGSFFFLYKDKNRINIDNLLEDLKKSLELI